MSDLIEALEIFKKYKDDKTPTHCSHDQLSVCGIDASDVTESDKDKLYKLGFFWSDEDDSFISFRFGSC